MHGQKGSRLPRAGSASLEGTRLPRAGSASLEGSPPPRSRPPHKHARPRTRVRAFNALTQQSRAIMRLGITPRRYSANSLGRNPSPPLWGTVRHGQCQLRDTAPPTPVRLTCRALEGGTATPSNRFLVNLQGQAMTLGRRNAIPATVGHRALLQPLRRCQARGDGTPPRLPLYPVRIAVNGFLGPV
jgi:hypothetical protein